MRAGPPVILGYHGIGEVAPEHDPIRLYVSPSELAADVRGLRKRGYELVTMSRFAELLEDGGPPPRGIAALTFDDGTADHAEVLPGLLEELDAPATIYVCPGLAGAPYPWTSPGAGIRFMSEAALVDLARRPRIEIGAHTNEHTELHEADASTAREVMETCKATLEDLLGIAVESFCYPRCHYSPAAARMARAVGYSSAVTCGMRGSWDRYELRREVMHSGEGRAVRFLRARGRYSGLGPNAPGRAIRLLARSADGAAARASR